MFHPLCSTDRHRLGRKDVHSSNRQGVDNRVLGHQHCQECVPSRGASLHEVVREKYSAFSGNLVSHLHVGGAGVFALSIGLYLVCARCVKFACRHVCGLYFTGVPPCRFMRVKSRAVQKAACWDSRQQ